MSEVSRNDDVRAVLGFLFRVLRMEMYQLRRDHRPHHFHESSKEPGGPRTSGRCGALKRFRPSWARLPSPWGPVVLLVKNAGNTLLSHPKEVDLVAQLEKLHRRVTAILEPKQAGIDSTLYLDKKAA